MSQYPLRDNPDLRAFSGRFVADISADRLAELSADDLRIHADALRQQAEFARQAGYDELAQNLLRAAELTLVPNEEVLKIYDMLRPERSTWDELIKLADYLENKYQASVTGGFIREAAEVYKERGLLRR